MIIPIRCFTCGRVVGSAYEAFQTKIKMGGSPKAALDELGLERYCCRRMILSHSELIDDVMVYD